MSRTVKPIGCCQELTFVQRLGTPRGDRARILHPGKASTAGAGISLRLPAPATRAWTMETRAQC